MLPGPDALVLVCDFYGRKIEFPPGDQVQPAFMALAARFGPDVDKPAAQFVPLGNGQPRHIGIGIAGPKALHGFAHFVGGLNENIRIVADAPQIEISSSFIRKAIREKKLVNYFLPEAVHQFIDKYGLYQ